MIQKFTFLFFFVLLLATCKEPIDPPAERDVCFSVRHHETLFPNSSVYIKFNTDFFPGYNDLSVFDKEITTNGLGHGCFNNVPEGRHWLISKGYDEATNEEVEGSIRVEMFGIRYFMDTVIYVSH